MKKNIYFTSTKVCSFWISRCKVNIKSEYGIKFLNKIFIEIYLKITLIKIIKILKPKPHKNHKNFLLFHFTVFGIEMRYRFNAFIEIKQTEMFVRRM